MGPQDALTKEIVDALSGLAVIVAVVLGALTYGLVRADALVETTTPQLRDQRESLRRSLHSTARLLSGIATVSCLMVALFVPLSWRVVYGFAGDHSTFRTAQLSLLLIQFLLGASAFVAVRQRGAVNRRALQLDVK